MFAVELVLIGLLLAALYCLPSIRAFCRRINPGNKITALIIITAFLLGHSLGVSRYTFPFVNWSMYSVVNETEQFETVKLIATSADGTQTEVNPVSYFPSLRRCFSSRFSKLVFAVDKKKVTKYGSQVYHELFDAILQNYNQQNPDRPAIEIAAVIEEVSTADGKVLDRRTVSTIRLQPNHLTNVSFPGGSPVMSNGEVNADE
jgi:hypothetical protein